jgi:hypothetical protein
MYKILLFIMFFLILFKSFSQDKIVNVYSPAKEVVVNSINNSYMQGGTTRIVVPLKLPQGSIGWFLRIVVVQREKVIETQTTLFNELLNIGSGITTAGISTLGSIALKSLNKPAAAQYCDLFVFDEQNSRNFSNKKSFSAFTKLENTVSTNEYFDNILGDNLYLGIRNNNQSNGIKVQIEVVAIVGDGWTKEKKQELYDKCIEELNKGALNTKQKEDLCYCFYTKLTKNEKLVELQNQPEIELKKLSEKYILNCTEELDNK